MQTILIIVAVLTVINVLIGIANLRKGKTGTAPATIAAPGAGTSVRTLQEDEKVVAAITAAVQLMLEQEAAATGLPRAGFIVKNIKKA